MTEPDRRAPVQPNRATGRLGGTIAWWEHEKAWLGYQKEWPDSAAAQDAERIAERSGFCIAEVVSFLGHEPETFEMHQRSDK